MKYRAYPHYKDSGVAWLGAVPEHWDIKRLKIAAHLCDKKVEANEENPLPYIGMENIESWSGKLLPIDPDIVPSGIANYFSTGTTLFGKLRPYLAKACNPDLDGLCSTELLVIQAEDFDRRALLYWLLADGFIKLVDSSTYGSKMPRANWDFIGNCELPVPPLTEQTAIADFLDSETGRIDTLVAKKRKLVELLKEKRSALISRTVTRGLPADAAQEFGLEPHTKFKDSRTEWLGNVPESWAVKKVKYVANVMIGITYSPEDIADENEGTLVLRASNIQNGRLSFHDNVYVIKEIKTKEFVQDGDILICSRNGSEHLVGKCAYLTHLHVGHTFGAFMSIVRSKIGRYLYYFFNSEIFKAQSGLFKTSTINQLTTNTLNNLMLAIPLPDEQTAIAMYLDRETAKIDRLVEKVETAINRLQEYRSALITAAVTGKIDVRDAVQ